MFELKQLSKTAVPAALEKAQRYRLLNDPLEAESICLDILEVDSGNEEARITLLLALSEQFDRKPSEKFHQAREIVEGFSDEYNRHYYLGILHERKAKTSLDRGGPGSGYMAYDGLRQAMECFEQAESARPKDNDDAILRWNTCARVVNRNPEVRPEPEEEVPQMLE